MMAIRNFGVVNFTKGTVLPNPWQRGNLKQRLEDERSS